MAYAHVRLFSWTLVFVTVVLHSAALAQALPAPAPLPSEVSSEPEEYRQAIDHAVQAMNLKQGEQAFAWFSQAHAIFPNARTFRGLALAEFMLKRHVDCIEHLDQALASTIKPLDAGLRADAEQLRTKARAYVARLDYTVLPDDTTLSVDGDVLHNERTHRRTLLLEVRKYQLEFAAPGYLPLRRTLTPRGGETQELAITLAKLPPAPLDERSSHGSRRKLWWWVSAGTAVVAGAVVTGVVLASRAHEAKPYTGTGGITVDGL